MGGIDVANCHSERKQLQPLSGAKSRGLQAVAIETAEESGFIVVGVPGEPTPPNVFPLYREAVTSFSPGLHPCEFHEH